MLPSFAADFFCGLCWPQAVESLAIRTALSPKILFRKHQQKRKWVQMSLSKSLMPEYCLMIPRFCLGQRH